ncbi:tetratricopeptide repeat protein [Desulfobacterales bacterium HSG17]|nr:tetratricopeptide repeat protein [Desulfobacterales bacterium HSG17]
MQKILHIKLKPLNDELADLRCFTDNPNDFAKRSLEFADIENLIADAEAGYYTLLPEDYVQTGQKLYQWLDGAERFLAQALKNCLPADTVVLAVEAEGRLAHLPWEVLHDGKSFLVQQINPYIVPVRWQDKKSPDYEPENRPLRVLFMACSPLDVKPVLDFEQEEGLILDATQRQPLVLSVEESGDLDELENLVASYEPGWFDVFHLTGHANLGDKGGYFITETETGESCAAYAADMGKALNRMPKIVFLSGCRTGEAGKDGAVPSLAEELLERGAKTVLGWGRPVLDTDASRAAAFFYGALSQGDDVALGLAKTRQEMIDSNARDWHLLRLYTAGEMPGSLVTPLKTRGRQKAAVYSKTTEFLDEQQKVKVPTRQGFVGRRRAIQRCLRALRNGDNSIGVILYGMGGLGKSSLAARLCDRLKDDFHVIVRMGELDEPGMVNRIGEDLDKTMRERILDPHDELKYKLKDVFANMETPLLLVLDDFERNFENDGKQPVLRNDGLPVISEEAQKIMEALVFAIGKNPDIGHKIIITTRYKPGADWAGHFYTEQLDRLPKPDVKKKIIRLESEYSALKSPDENLNNLKQKAVIVADGNPRLLEWLFEILDQADLDHDIILKRMNEKEIEFRESILAEELLKQQDKDLCRMLGLMLVYELAVPFAAIEAVCEKVSDLKGHMNRASALGLLEVTQQVDENVFRVPRILSPLLEEYWAEDGVELCGIACRVLYDIWLILAGTCTEEQGLEIHRLALARKDAEIAGKIGNYLSTAWHNQSRFHESQSLCRKTMKMTGDNYRLIQNLARADEILGNTADALKHYQACLDMCPDSDKEEKAAAMHNMARIYTNQEQINEALSLYQQISEIDESIGNIQGKASTLHQMAGIYANQGKINEALSLYQQSLEITENIGDVKTKAVTLHELARIYANKGQIKDAFSLYQQSLEITERIGDLKNKAAALHQMAGLYEDQKQIKEALSLYQQSLEITESIGDVQGKAATLNNMAVLYADQGDYGRVQNRPKFSF